MKHLSLQMEQSSKPILKQVVVGKIIHFPISGLAGVKLSLVNPLRLRPCSRRLCMYHVLNNLISSKTIALDIEKISSVCVQAVI